MTCQAFSRPWAAPFLRALQDGLTIADAAARAGTKSATAYGLRQRDAAFNAAWEAIRPGDGRVKRGPTGKHTASERIAIERFIEELAETSNVAAAAASSGLDKRRAYHLRRNDPDFARRWYAALAEGYDNLEMELLQHLRGTESADLRDSGQSAELGESRESHEPGDQAERQRSAHPPSPVKRKFDTATALRCLTAHRESVAREKGRRRLADEIATIDAINRRIDALRARKRESDAAIRKARKTRGTRGAKGLSTGGAREAPEAQAARAARAAPQPAAPPTAQPDTPARPAHGGTGERDNDRA